MIVNAAIFTCSICGEPSTQICAYCTKDACGNHRCVRCKRCSDCCECEFPLSAEEAVVPEAAAEPVPEPVPELFEPQEIETPEPARDSSAYPFLTPEESSVFAEEDEETEPRDATEPRDPTDPVS